MRQEAVEVVLLKVDLAVICTKADLLRLFSKEIRPGIQCLEAQAAGEGHVGTEIHHHMKPQDLPVKGLGPLHVPDCQQGIFQLHKISPFLKRIVLPGLTAVWTAPLLYDKIEKTIQGGFCDGNHCQYLLHGQPRSCPEIRRGDDTHHASPMMAQIARLREQYDLHMRVERYLSDETPTTSQDEAFIRR